MNKVIIYACTASKEQAKKGFSLSAQVDQCLEFAKCNGFRVVKILKNEEVCSRDLNRPRLHKIFKCIKKNHKSADAFIFWRLDRIMRNVEDFVQLKKILKKYKIKAISVE